MSLANEDITAQNFKDFYDRIFPYLNGAAHAGFTPCGTVIAYFGETAPQNYLICDGSQYNKTDYPQLWTLLSSLTDSTPYVVDGDNTKFKVPDLRGEFLRGSGTNSHENQGNGGDIGEHQNGTEHLSIVSESDTVFGAYGSSIKEANPDSYIYNKTRGRYVDTNDTSNNYDVLYTSRPTNTSVLYCIAYQDIFMDVTNAYGVMDSTDLEEIFDGSMPTVENKMPILFDEKGEERKVGWYRLSNGTKKPVYEKTYSGTATLNNSSITLCSVNISNLEKILIVNGSIEYETGKYMNLNCEQNQIWIDNGNLKYHDVGVRNNTPYIITLQYTKTTDTPI